MRDDQGLLYDDPDKIAFDFLRARELYNALRQWVEALARRPVPASGVPIDTTLSTTFPLGGGGLLASGLTLTSSQGRTGSGGLLSEWGGILSHNFGPSPYQVPTAAAAGRSWIIFNPSATALTISDEAGGSIISWNGSIGTSAVLSSGQYRTVIIEKVSASFIRVMALTAEAMVIAPYNPSLTDLTPGAGISITGSGRSRTISATGGGGNIWLPMADTGDTTVSGGGRLYVGSTAAGNTVGGAPTANLYVDLADGTDCEILIDAGACVVRTAGGAGQGWYKVAASGGGDIGGAFLGLGLGQLLMRVIRVADRQRFTLTLFP